MKKYKKFHLMLENELNELNDGGNTANTGLGIDDGDFDPEKEGNNLGGNDPLDGSDGSDGSEVNSEIQDSYNNIMKFNKRFNSLSETSVKDLLKQIELTKGPAAAKAAEKLLKIRQERLKYRTLTPKDTTPIPQYERPEVLSHNSKDGFGGYVVAGGPKGDSMPVPHNKAYTDNMPVPQNMSGMRFNPDAGNRPGPNNSELPTNGYAPSKDALGENPYTVSGSQANNSGYVPSKDALGENPYSLSNAPDYNNPDASYNAEFGTEPYVDDAGEVLRHSGSIKTTIPTGTATNASGGAWDALKNAASENWKKFSGGVSDWVSQNPNATLGIGAAAAALGAYALWNRHRRKKLENKLINKSLNASVEYPYDYYSITERNYYDDMGNYLYKDNKPEDLTVGEKVDNTLNHLKFKKDTFFKGLLDKSSETKGKLLDATKGLLDKSSEFKDKASDVYDKTRKNLAGVGIFKKDEYDTPGNRIDRVISKATGAYDDTKEKVSDSVKKSAGWGFSRLADAAGKVSSWADRKRGSLNSSVEYPYYDFMNYIGINEEEFTYDGIKNAVERGFKNYNTSLAKRMYDREQAEKLAEKIKNGEVINPQSAVHVTNLDNIKLSVPDKIEVSNIPDEIKVSNMPDIPQPMDYVLPISLGVGIGALGAMSVYSLIKYLISKGKRKEAKELNDIANSVDVPNAPVSEGTVVSGGFSIDANGNPVMRFETDGMNPALAGGLSGAAAGALTSLSVYRLIKLLEKLHKNKEASKVANIANLATETKNIEESYDVYNKFGKNIGLYEANTIYDDIDDESDDFKFSRNTTKEDVAKEREDEYCKNNKYSSSEDEVPYDLLSGKDTSGTDYKPSPKPVPKQTQPQPQKQKPKSTPKSAPTQPQTPGGSVFVRQGNGKYIEVPYGRSGGTSGRSRVSTDANGNYILLPDVAKGKESGSASDDNKSKPTSTKLGFFGRLGQKIDNRTKGTNNKFFGKIGSWAGKVGDWAKKHTIEDSVEYALSKYNELMNYGNIIRESNDSHPILFEKYNEDLCDLKLLMDDLVPQALSDPELPPQVRDEMCNHLGMKYDDEYAGCDFNPDVRNAWNSYINEPRCRDNLDRIECIKNKIHILKDPRLAMQICGVATAATLYFMWKKFMEMKLGMEPCNNKMLSNVLFVTGSLPSKLDRMKESYDYKNDKYFMNNINTLIENAYSLNSLIMHDLSIPSVIKHMLNEEFNAFKDDFDINTSMKSFTESIDFSKSKKKIYF